MLEHLKPEVEVDGVGNCGAVACGFCNKLCRVEAADWFADDVGAHADHFAGDFNQAFTTAIDKIHLFYQCLAFGVNDGPLAAYEADSPVERILKCCQLFFETLGEKDVVAANKFDVLSSDLADCFVPVAFGAEVTGVPVELDPGVGK